MATLNLYVNGCHLVYCSIVYIERRVKILCIAFNKFNNCKFKINQNMDYVAIWFEDGDNDNDCVDRIQRKIIRDKSNVLSLSDPRAV